MDDDVNFGAWRVPSLESEDEQRLVEKLRRPQKSRAPRLAAAAIVVAATATAALWWGRAPTFEQRVARAQAMVQDELAHRLVLVDAPESARRDYL